MGPLDRCNKYCCCW